MFNPFNQDELERAGAASQSLAAAFARLTEKRQKQDELLVAVRANIVTLERNIVELDRL